MDQITDLISRASNRGASRPYIAACVLAAPVAFDVARTLEKVRDLAADASTKARS